MDLATDPVAMIWHARNILAEIEELTETDEVLKILAELEMILFDSILRIIAVGKERDKPRLHLVSPLTG